MAYLAKAVANYFIDLAKKDEKELTPLKLIKLVYIAHGWNLALENQPLINERVFAWRYGPVIEPLYQEFKKFGKDQVTDCARENGYIPRILKNDIITKTLIEKVWEQYGYLSGIELSSLTHKKGSPWDQACYGEEGDNNPISDELIKDYYKKLSEAN